ncbi:putative L-threonine 3-dehydrogenase [Clostridium pasteurianum DSM 525 = ATCC 6013]|uniref:L-threonine 3-dehydrogenase n=1 Tax=Clostridium pasteurianum DSM 525 = ATCC 6013 TaxID=1262449 RepID=A0A0H3J7S4_CLOPA|nr:L-threonine dehydrogenase [Clostridium pasteurianum]AJA47963.1 putative L-threonine 3-dehydrogenase [Clostridium pasteurianum DSM 525 = ATCC 6013]AJA51951.1 putative L-threonine 3-dehydrogenase [Clostridium pasteurianum DSM 525 = ATCC 6013]AOZ75249.1 alcohol dehydrogenase [Clostridium pasteurianum DSM 525 = ATCC 6013]AOZ79044.1 alcohol dehydrogenase [Clostridium pasteurianum]ELP59866.1 molecular chaperone GroES [Clostridium pasteurianum DSM 525 = ATCC 6013]
MKAAVFYGKNNIKVEDRECRKMTENEILVKVKACGVCGTDIHIFNGEEGSAPVTPPIILGHEYSGEVVKVGNKVEDIKIGDKVVIDPNIYCGECDNCRNGKKQLCENLTALGVNIDGGFSEYCVVPKEQAYTFNNISFEEAAMVEPTACCLHGINNIEIKPGDKVLVLGAGAIGLIMLQLAKISGASIVGVSEPIEKRRNTALELGADYVLNPMEESFKNNLNRYLGKGPDVIIECTGNKYVIESAFDIAKRGTRILLFGVSSPDVKVEISPFEIFKKELIIKGSLINPDTHLSALNLITSGKINVKPLITNKFELDKVEEALEMQKSVESVKVLVVS